MVCSPAPLAVGWADKARRHACTVKAPLSRVGTVRGCLDQARAGRRRSSVDSDGAEPERRLRDERGCRGCAAFFEGRECSARCLERSSTVRSRRRCVLRLRSLTPPYTTHERLSEGVVQE
jgi:hypothetical protein